MKINYFTLLILLNLIFSIGCAQAGKNSPMSYNMDVKRSLASEGKLIYNDYYKFVLRITDNENHIICYIFYTKTTQPGVGISCLPLPESN